MQLRFVPRFHFKGAGVKGHWKTPNLIDLLTGRFRGTVFQRVGGARKQPLSLDTVGTACNWFTKPRVWESRKKSENESPGPLGAGAQKAPKNGVENESKQLKIVDFDSFSTRFRIRFGLFGTPGPRGPRDSFSNFSFRPKSKNLWQANGFPKRLAKCLW